MTEGISTQNDALWIREIVTSDAQAAAELSGEFGYPLAAELMEQRIKGLAFTRCFHSSRLQVHTRSVGSNGHCRELRAGTAGTSGADCACKQDNS